MKMLAEKQWLNVLVVVAYVAIGVLIAAILFPIYWIFLSSLKTEAEVISIPPIWWTFSPRFENYIDVFRTFPRFWFYLLNSFVSSIVTTIIVVSVSCFTAYALARMRWRGREILTLGILATRIIPTITLVIPLYILMHKLRMLDTLFGLILALIALNLPFGVWILKAFIETIPPSLEECAMIDGCSRFKAFVKITIPLISPGIATASVFCLMVSWNQFLIPLILTRDDAKTLPVLAGQFMTKYSIHWGRVNAVMITMALPLILGAWWAQKYIIAGLSEGALKE